MNGLGFESQKIERGKLESRKRGEKTPISSPSNVEGSCHNLRLCFASHRRSSEIHEKLCYGNEKVIGYERETAKRTLCRQCRCADTTISRPHTRKNSRLGNHFLKIYRKNSKPHESGRVYRLVIAVKRVSVTAIFHFHTRSYQAIAYFDVASFTA